MNSYQNQSQMPIPLAYTSHSKSDFVFPRRPPTPAQYSAPILARTEPVYDRPRHPLLTWISDDVRNHLVAMLGEFMGTFSFLFFALTAVQTANSKPDTLPRIDFLSDSPSLLQITYISFVFGCGLAVNVYKGHLRLMPGWSRTLAKRCIACPYAIFGCHCRVLDGLRSLSW